MLPRHFQYFHCFNFKMIFDKNFMKKAAICNCKMAVLWIITEIFKKYVFCLLNLSKLKTYKTFNFCSIRNMHWWLLYGYKSKAHKLTIYKKLVAECTTLSFSVISFFQHFDWKICDTLSDIVELYKKYQNVSKQMVAFAQHLLWKSC